MFSQAQLLTILMGACFSAISFLLIDVLQGLRKSIDALNKTVETATKQISNHEMRIAVSESKIDALENP